MNRLEATLQEALAQGTLVSLRMSDARRPQVGEARKVVVKPVQIRGERRYQFAFHSEAKVTHQNLTREETAARILALLTETFRQGQLRTTTAEIHIVASPSGKIILREKPAAPTVLPLEHDRPKNYLLPEGQPCDFLIQLGVMNAEGRVLAAKYDKFKQINRFLEMVADVAEELDGDAPLRVVDFGCGKSYLTFALYHYLRQRQNQTGNAPPLTIIGLDRKADVVARCNAIARDLGYAGLEFFVGDIAEYEGLDSVDMVVSLHACDTATDDALVKAIAWNAKVILAVPCCQKEFSRQIANDIQRPLLKHGLFRERLAALVTDAVRAELLERAGYSVQVLEFIALEHTAKNLLLRAVRRDRKAAVDCLRREYETFRDFWSLNPYLESALARLESISKKAET